MYANVYRLLLAAIACFGLGRGMPACAGEMWDVDAAREANVRRITKHEQLTGEPFVFVTFVHPDSATLVNDRLVESINKFTQSLGEAGVRRRIVEEAVVDEDWEYRIPGVATYRVRTSCFGCYDAAKRRMANAFLILNVPYHPGALFGEDRIGNAAFARHLRGSPDKPHVAVSFVRGNAWVHLYIPKMSPDGTRLEEDDVKKAPDVRAVAHAIDQYLLVDPLDSLRDEARRSRKTVTLAIDGRPDLALGKNYELSLSAGQGEKPPSQIRLRVSRGNVSAQATVPGSKDLLPRFLPPEKCRYFVRFSQPGKQTVSCYHMNTEGECTAWGALEVNVSER